MTAKTKTLPENQTSIHTSTEGAVKMQRAKKAAKPAVSKKKPASINGVAPYQEKAGEEYMSAQQREHFRNLLLHRMEELMQEVDRTLHHMQDNADDIPADPNDRASREEEHSLELRTRDRERKLIRKIEETLQKIEDDEYGYCDACGIEIGIRRLEARPTATLCIDCKTLEEIRERQNTGG